LVGIFTRGIFTRCAHEKSSPTKIRSLSGIAGSSHRQRKWGFGMAEAMNLRVNGQEVTVVVEPDAPLLYILRNDAGVIGPHFGCGLGQCGACTIHINGEAVRSCQLPLSSVTPNDEIITLEGLGSPENPHPLQTAFIEEQAVQCGYCTNGMIMQAAAFLKRTPAPTEAEIKKELANNLCRCSNYLRILRAVKRASETKGGRP
jgi:nicotinate dehydrogenase subunit A